MSEQHPHDKSFPVRPNEHRPQSARSGSGFNVNSIPRFHNPKHIQHKKPGISLPPPLHTEQQVQGTAKHVPPAHLHHHTQKQKQRKKLHRLRSHKHWHTLRFAVISFVVFLIVFNYQVIYSQALYLFDKKPVSTPQPAQVIPTQQQQSNQAEVVDAQNIIIIPKIGVQAPLVFPDTIDEQLVLRALQDGVVHYAGTAKPGENGNSVFFGHSSNDVWEKGNYKFVFVLLEKLVPGDQYEIHYQSRKYVYTVEETRVVNPNDLSVLNQTSTPYSTLITCTPPGTSWKRFIVKAKQTQPTPVTTTQIATQTQPITTNKVLPSAAPSLPEQVQMILRNIIALILGKSTTNGVPSENQSTPTNRLPEVSTRDTMPTIF